MTDLIQLLNVPADLIQWHDISASASEPVPAPVSLLDEDIPQTVLNPVQPVQALFPKTTPPLLKPLEKLKQFGEWLFSYIPPMPKVLGTTFNYPQAKGNEPI